MILTKEQVDEMLLVSRPLIQWIAENCHPHCFALVDSVTVQLVEGIATNRTEDYLKD